MYVAIALGVLFVIVVRLLLNNHLDFILSGEISKMISKNRVLGILTSLLSLGAIYILPVTGFFYAVEKTVDILFNNQIVDDFLLPSYYYLKIFISLIKSGLPKQSFYPLSLIFLIMVLLTSYLTLITFKISAAKREKIIGKEYYTFPILCFVSTIIVSAFISKRLYIGHIFTNLSFYRILRLINEFPSVETTSLLCAFLFVMIEIITLAFFIHAAGMKGIIYFIIMHIEICLLQFFFITLLVIVLFLLALAFLGVLLYGASKSSNDLIDEDGHTLVYVGRDFWGNDLFLDKLTGQSTALSHHHVTGIILRGDNGKRVR